MISLTQLRTLPKIKQEQEKQEKLQSYLFSIQNAIIQAWRNHKASVTIDCENDIMDGHELQKYLTSKNFKVDIHYLYDPVADEKVPENVEIFFTEAEF